MPELGTYGSVRGALSNERPYRDPGSQPPAFGRSASPRNDSGCLCVV